MAAGRGLDSMTQRAPQLTWEHAMWILVAWIIVVGLFLGSS
jgi:hypothetical protein